MRRKAFTLLELLVVVAIIVVLIAVLVPALDKAMSAAELARCSANLHGIGTAMATYLEDHQDSYPTVNNWNTLLGNAGLTGYGGFNDDTDKRPLNKYLGVSGTGSPVKSAQCPSDKGESLVVSNNTYADWGTSYISYIVDYSRIKRPFGYGGAAGMKKTQVRRADNKVILPEWPTLGNRGYDSPQNRWHREEPDPYLRWHNTLFADSHAELFGYDRIKMEVDNAAEPDPSNSWW